MKGEHFKMKNHGLRRVFSLLLALFMVFTLLPTAALAEENTDLTDTQVVETEGEKKADPPAPQSQEAPEQKPATVETPAGGTVQDTKDSTPPPLRLPRI